MMSFSFRDIKKFPKNFIEKLIYFFSTKPTSNFKNLNDKDYFIAVPKGTTRIKRRVMDMEAFDNKIKCNDPWDLYKTSRQDIIDFSHALETLSI